MRYISNYSEFEQTNEGLKTWLSTFLLMANLGLVPLNVKSADAQTKKEFIDNQPQDKVDAAKFVTFLNKYGFRLFGWYRIIVGGTILLLLGSDMSLSIV